MEVVPGRGNHLFPGQSEGPQEDLSSGRSSDPLSPFDGEALTSDPLSNGEMGGPDKGSEKHSRAGVRRLGWRGKGRAKKMSLEGGTTCLARMPQRLKQTPSYLSQYLNNYLKDCSLRRFDSHSRCAFSSDLESPEEET